MNDSAAGRASIESGGLRLRALCWAASDRAATPVLLLHATSFCAETWRPTWESACRAGFTGGAVAPDARGHGESDPAPTPEACAWTLLAQDVVAWIDALPDLLPDAGDRSRGVVLVGHSSGATCALAAAAERPGRVRGVLALEPVLFDPPAAGADADSYAGSRFMAQQARRRRATFASAGEARERLASRPPYAGFAPETLAAFLEGGLAPVPGGYALRCAPETEAACYDGAATLDVWSALGRIVCPVRIVAGDRGFIPAPLLERLQKRLPGTGVETVKDGTHFVALERPAEVGAAMTRFVREVTPIRVA